MTKRKFNWLDALCILLVLAIIAGAIWYLKKDDTAAPADTKPYVVTLRFTQATTDPHDFYKVGDKLHFFTRSAELGTITSVESIDWVREEFNETTGEYYTYVDPQHKQIEMKVLTQGSVEGGMFTVNGSTLLIGGTYYPQTDATRSVMVVWDIEEVAA